MIKRRAPPVPTIVPSHAEGAPCTFELTYFVC
jgi:hypothetical protein